MPPRTRYSFILKSLQAKVGDIVATPTDMPGHEGNAAGVVWGAHCRYRSGQSFLPAEAAQELRRSGHRHSRHSVVHKVGLILVKSLPVASRHGSAPQGNDSKSTSMSSTPIDWSDVR